MRNEVTDLLIEELNKYGLKGTISDRSKHLEVSWEGVAGPRFIIAPRTPSDWRSGLNCRSQLRGMLRKDGQPILEDHPMSFQKAMSLPKETVVTQVARDRALQRDVEVLCEVVMELQDQIRTLNEKLDNVTVVSTVMSTVKFAGQQVVEEFPQATPFEKEVIKLVDKAEKGDSTPGERLLSVLNFQWKDIKQILNDMRIHSLSSLEAKAVRNLIQYYRRKGLVENGARGMWRRKLDGGNAF